MSEASDQRSAGFGGRAAKGAVFSGMAQAVRVAVQLGSVVFLSRLLAPADFGLLAMVGPLYELASLFQDLGLSQATVQSKEVTPTQSSALFWLNLTVGFAVAVPLFLVAPGAAWFYSEPRVAALTQGFAILVLIAALGSQHQALLNRGMRFRYLAVLDTVAALAGFLGALMFARLTHSYWALYASVAIACVVNTAGAWIGVGFVPRLPRWDSGVRNMMHVGIGIAGYNVFTFVARNLDNVLIGRVWGDVALGLYDRAYKFLMFPLIQIQGPLSQVMLPILARLQGEAERYRSAYLAAVNQLMLVTQPGIVFAIATADVAIPMLLGEQWRGVAPIFRWLGVAALLQPISLTTNWLFISQGRSGAFARFGAFNAVMSAAAFCAGLPWGAIGVAAAYSISQLLLRSPVGWRMATQSGPVRFWDLCGVAGLHALASAGSFAAILAARRAENLESLFGLAACLALSYAATALVLGLTAAGRAILRQAVSMVALVRR